MGLEKSELNDEKITKLLKDKYNIEVNEIKKIDIGTSNLFIIYGNKGRYVLKEFTSKRNKNTVNKEIDIINFLRGRNIDVPKYIQTIDNEFYIENEGRIIILQEYIEGYVIESNKGDYKETIENATLLGKLVKNLKEYKKLDEEDIIKENFSKDRINDGIKKMEKLKNEIKDYNQYRDKIIEDLEFKIKVSKEINENFDFNIINNLTKLNSHGDFCTLQLIHNKNTTTIIDFEKAKKLPIIWEIMRSYSYIDREVENGEINIDNLVDYIKEFNKFVYLNEYDLKYASYIYLLQLISSTYGYKEYNNDITQVDLLKFAFFRTNLCKNLYNNKELISERLLKECI